MKKYIKYSKMIAFSLMLSSFVGLVSCEKKDFEYISPVPKISFVDATNTSRKQVPNGLIKFEVNLQGLKGIKAALIKANGVEVKREDLTSKNDLSINFTVNYTVPATAKPGDKIALTVETVDNNEVSSAPITYNIEVVGSTFTVTDVIVAGQTLSQITGIINVDYEIPANGKVLLNGKVEVEEGIKLTIGSGSIIYAKTGLATPSYLSTKPKATLLARGTKTAPIVMTSDKVLTNNAAAGDWGGLVINGQARVNSADGTATGVTGKFGGAVDTDNSGTIEYVRVEFAGGGGGADILEGAGITLNGVGSGTVVRFVQSINSSALGFYINGGKVNLKNIISMNSRSHEIYGERGWRGFGQFWVTHSTLAGERGIQMSSYPSTLETFALTEPIISNVTLVGPGFGQPSTFANIGVRFRRGAKAKLYNALVTQFPSSGVRIDADVNTEYLAGTLLLANSNIFQNSAATAHSNNFHSSARAEWRDKPTFSNLVTPVALTNDFVGTSTVTPFTGLVTLNAWFTKADYRGAVPSGSGDWIADGTWCKNAKGEIL
jgi:hypothetical protein